jgi:hypothetical protein
MLDRGCQLLIKPPRLGTVRLYELVRILVCTYEKSRLRDYEYEYEYGLCLAGLDHGCQLLIKYLRVQVLVRTYGPWILHLLPPSALFLCRVKVKVEAPTHLLMFRSHYRRAYYTSHKIAQALALHIARSRRSVF